MSPDAAAESSLPAAASGGVTMTPQEQEIASLFDRWNRSLQTGDPERVVALYAEDSVLLPTVSGRPRFTAEEKADYFRLFLANRPTGAIDWRRIHAGHDLAVDTGHYTFRFAANGDMITARYSFTYRKTDGCWLIVSHHSSRTPEP